MSLNIVLTDCATVTSGDIDLSVFERFGNVRYYDETTPQLTAERIKDADIIVINKTVIGKNELDAAKNLKLIALFATGYNNVDTAYAREKGVTVCNAGSYSTSAVAQQVFGYILGNACKISEYDSDVKNQKWIHSRLFCLFSRPTCELAGKTLGIFGFGAIGKRVAEIAKAFEMRVIVCTRTPKNDSSVEFVDFDTLLSQSDYLTLHCPLTPATKGLIGEEELHKMKPTSIIINVARGGIIEEEALAKALNEGVIAGAGLDVFSDEPLHSSPLYDLADSNTLVAAPHTAWASDMARNELVRGIARNIEEYLQKR